MIVGLGIDIADSRRIDRIYRKFGARFLRHILSPAEIESMPANAGFWLAGRFAAKEAGAKALGTGFADGIAPAMLEVFNLRTGAPELFFRDAALARASLLGADKWRLSISHEKYCAAAVVILED